MSSAPLKRAVLGVGISATSYAEVTKVCAQWMRQEPSADIARYVCVTSVHGIILSQQDGVLRNVLDGADIATPDGMPVVWALRSFGARNQQRVYGPTLMLRLCQMAAEERHGIFLYGSTRNTLDRLVLMLLNRFPTLEICGTYAPPFRELTLDEDLRMQEQVRQSGARLVFVGISTPKQDFWMSRHRHCFPGLVLVGVGAAFDFHAGRVRQAPRWMQSAGLEWFFRLCAEPRRLWKRYLLVTPQFLPLWAWQWLAFHFRGRHART